MTYYEEFGLSPVASAEQIRHCYKALAKLLHPDQIPDDNLKGLAELQMRRLNQILAVLTDPERRRKYDASLQVHVEPVRHRPAGTRMPSQIRARPRRLLIALCVWGLPLAALIAFLLFFLADAGLTNSGPIAAAVSDAGLEVGPSQVPALTERQPRVSPPDPPVERHAGRDKPPAGLRSAESQLDALRAEHERSLEVLWSAARPVLREQQLTNPISETIPRRMMDARPPAPVRHPASGFIGHWYYVPAERDRTAKGMYLPEYIELHVSENAGIMHGRYQARYKVTDQAIEPEVAFRFDGIAGSPEAQFPWTGPGAAQGEVTLRLLSGDQIEVNWSATQLSAELNLASGSAQLIRQREP